MHGALERAPYTILSPTGGRADVTCSYYRLAPGQKLTLHVHDNRTEVWFLVQGTARLTLGHEVETIVAPAAVIAPPNTPHALVNVGPDAVLFVNFATPRVQTGPDGRNLGTTELE